MCDIDVKAEVLTMRLLLRKKLLAATLVAAFFSAAAFAGLSEVDAGASSVGALPTAESWYADVSALATPDRAGSRVMVEVDLAASPGFSLEKSGEARYRMAFNNIAEGWSWQPLADPAVEDYYRWKFLPLQSVTQERGHYLQEEKIGEPQDTQIVWRYDYFLAFDNPYDFYVRAADDDAGFVAAVAAGTSRVRMVAVAVLMSPVLSESSTFWKAIYSQPTDFMLKKRYLVARLEQLLLVDPANGDVLARIKPLSAQR